jgi:predicted nucleic acid-binding protein
MSLICVDTTFLVDLWRTRDQPGSPPKVLLQANPGAEFAVQAHAAGEFLEGGAAISPERLDQSLAFLRLFRVGEVGVETAYHYARVVSALRRETALAGRSKPDLWIAAWAMQHAAPLVTRNTKHFGGIPDLQLIDYSLT